MIPFCPDRPRPSGDESCHQAGFTLLEAIIAVTVLSVGLIPILVLMSQAAAQLVRASEANIASHAKLSALEAMEAVNPVEQPDGRMDIGSLVIRWDSEPIVTPSRPSTRLPALGGYLVGYYDMDVEVADQRGKKIASFRLGKVGYRELQAAPGMAPQ